MKRQRDIIVTTGDLKRDYKVLGPVYFQVSNKGLFGSALGNIKKQYSYEFKLGNKVVQCLQTVRIGVFYMASGQ